MRAWHVDQPGPIDSHPLGLRAREFLAFAAEHPLRVTTHRYSLDAAGQALADLKHGRFDGAAVLVND